jgi:hypothetical protein
MSVELKKQAVSKCLRSALRRQGISEERIEQVVRETIGGKEAQGLKKLPRIVSERLKKLLAGPGSVAVVVRGRGRGIRVFSLEGYKTLVKQGHTTGTQNMKDYQARQAAHKAAHHKSAAG